GTRFELGDNSVFNAPNLTDIRNAILDLGPGRTFTTGQLSQIDSAAIRIAGGLVFDRVTDSSYTTEGLDRGRVLSATGVGSVLSLRTVQSMRYASFFGGGDQSVIAENGGLVDFSGLQSITPVAGEDNSLSFTAQATGEIRFGGLSVLTPTSGQRVNFSVTGGGRMRFGDMLVVSNSTFAVNDLDSRMDVARSVFLQGGTLSMPSGGTLAVGKHLYNQSTNEATANLTQTILQFSSPGLHLLEVGGRDVGAMDPANNGNFGIGRIEVGLPGAPASLQLLELFNNGNRGSNLPEALYLYGIGQGTPLESLVLHSGSILYLDNINVYARENGQWIWLNSLFGTCQTGVPYGGGDLHLRCPGAAALVVLAGVVAARRRR
ncbi:MAG: hypothetical protein ACK5QX_03670, partial [bacterium]